MPGFVYYKKGCFRLTATSDKVYQLLAHGWWFSPGTPTSSTTKTGRHDIAEILLKVALNTKIQILFWTQSEDVCFGDQSEDVCLETQSENVCFGDTISGRLLWRPIRGRLLWIFFGDATRGLLFQTQNREHIFWRSYTLQYRNYAQGIPLWFISTCQMLKHVIRIGLYFYLTIIL